MQRGSRMTVLGVLLASALGLGACGGGGSRPQVHTLAYRSGVPLHAQVVQSGREGPLRLERVSYTSVDGQRVPALFAIPTDRSPLGCLLYEGDFGQTRFQRPDIRRGAAALRLASFTIDPRNEGTRGGPAIARTAIEAPETLLAMVLDTVVDLRVGLDYLETRAECHHRIAYLGSSFGAALGALLAARDRRVQAVVLTSVGATFKGAVLVSNLAALADPKAPVMVPGAANDASLLARAVSVLGPYDPVKWVGKIAPRPVMVINGRRDPYVLPIDALELAAATRDPKTVLYVDAGHDPFAPGPAQQFVAKRSAEFLRRGLGI